MVPNDAQRQTCKVCHRRDKFDFHVPNEMWAAIVPPEFRNRVVCLACFDDFAVEAGINYSCAIDVIYFAGDQANFQCAIINARDRQDYWQSP